MNSSLDWAEVFKGLEELCLCALTADILRTTLNKVPVGNSIRVFFSSVSLSALICPLLTLTAVMLSTAPECPSGLVQ